MSRWWHKALTVELTPERVTVLERGVRPSRTHKPPIIVETQSDRTEDSVSSLMQCFSEALTRARARGMPVEATLSQSYLRVALVLSDDTIETEEERQQLALLRLQEIYGADADISVVALQPELPRHAFVAYGVDRQLLEQIQSVCKSNGARLVQLTPLLADSLRRAREMRNANEYWMAHVETGRVVVALMRGYLCQHLTTRHFDAQSPQTLFRILEQEALLTGLKSRPRTVTLSWMASAKLDRAKLQSESFDVHVAADTRVRGNIVRRGAEALLARTIPTSFVVRTSARRAMWSGWALAAVAGLFCIDLAVSYRDVTSELTRIRGQLGSASITTRVSSTETAKNDGPLEAELRSAQKIIRGMTVPWNELFDELEGAYSETVAVLSVAPEPEKGNLTINGEAKDYPALLTYIARLDHSPAFAKVALTRHEINDADPRRPVAFTLSASWKVKS